MSSSPRGRISVVMATYNGERFIAQQLDSILNQTTPPDEIIIADDGSTDGTIAIAEEYRSRHPIIKVTRNSRNLGVNANFLKAIEASTGDFIFTSDQDDLWRHDKINKMVQMWKGESLLYSDAQVIDQEGRIIEPSEISWFRQTPIQGRHPLYFFFKNSVSGHNLMLTRGLAESLIRTGVEIDGMMYDQWFALVASLKDGIGYVPETLCQHRIHARNHHNNPVLRRDQKKMGRLKPLKRLRFERQTQQIRAAFAALRIVHPTLHADSLLGDLARHFECRDSVLFNGKLFCALVQSRSFRQTERSLWKLVKKAIRISAGHKLWWLSVI